MGIEMQIPLPFQFNHLPIAPGAENSPLDGSQGIASVAETVWLHQR
jgi:hypothetical protein